MAWNRTDTAKNWSQPTDDRQISAAPSWSTNFPRPGGSAFLPAGRGFTADGFCRDEQVLLRHTFVAERPTLVCQRGFSATARMRTVASFTHRPFTHRPVTHRPMGPSSFPTADAAASTDPFRGAENGTASTVNSGARKDFQSAVFGRDSWWRAPAVRRCSFISASNRCRLPPTSIILASRSASTKGW